MKKSLVAATAALLAALTALPPAAAEAKTAVPAGPYATSWWVNDALHITYSYMGPFTAASSDSYVRVEVDGKVVDAPEDFGFQDRAVTVPREASAGPAHIEVISDALFDRGSYDDVVPTVYYSATAYQTVMTAGSGQVPIATMLDGLRVAKETRAKTYRSSRFGSSALDADRDGETTRDEVLAAESAENVTRIRRHVVKTGRWPSVYDDVTITDAAKAAVDHLVPLQEAWTSGAAAWSTRRRIAFANDVVYDPSLTVVSKRGQRIRRDREPTSWLPSDDDYRCGYVRDWISVKSRWGLTVDPAEKAALALDLDRYCADPFVTTPPRPDVQKLAGATKRVH